MKRLVAGTLAAALALGASAAPSVKALIIQSRSTKPDLTNLTVRLQATGLTLGAYQGTLRYAPGAFSVVAAKAPLGDGTRAVNTADSAKGIVRFVGFTTNGFRTNDVLVLSVRFHRPIAEANLRADLQAAGDIAGVAVPKTGLIPARGFTTAAER